MRLLQVSIRSLLLYSLILVVISVPVSLFSIQTILSEEVDESLAMNSNEFINHLKNFEYLDDLETDLHVLDQLSYNIHIKPATQSLDKPIFQTVFHYDSAEDEKRPFRQLSQTILVKGRLYNLTLSMSLVDNQDLITAIGIVQVLLIVLLTGGLLFINRTLSKNLWKPFYKTISQLKAYELDKNENFETEKTKIIEFDDLNKAIRQLSNRNRRVFLQQKEFIENASHELQTPIAIFHSKLDVLMQHEGISESMADTISELEATARRMSKLNKNLLLLSKIDNEQFIERESVDLHAVIRDLYIKIKPIAELNQLTTTSSIHEGVIWANKTLIEVLITNLFHNAVRHTEEKGVIDIVFENHKLTVSNSGKPLSIDAEKIFERFRKDSRHTESTGLGLAIVRKICDISGYSLTYTYGNGQHHFIAIFSSTST